MEIEQQINEASRAVDSGNYSAAVKILEPLVAYGEKFPLALSAYAVCLAELNRKYAEAVSFCQSSIAAEPCVTQHYLQLGRVYIAADMRPEAIRVLREALLYRQDQRIVSLLERLGVRRRPFFRSLSRSHPLNRLAGRILVRIGLA